MIYPFRTALPRRMVPVLAAVAVASACDLTDPLPVEPLIQTDATTYQLVSDADGLSTEIPYVFENRTGASVYLVNCNGVFALRLERLERGQWNVAWSPVLPLCLSPPIVIEAGATFAATLHVWGSPPNQNSAPSFDVADPSGTYRLVWDAALSSFQDYLPFGEPIPFPYRVSNPFTLRAE